MNENSIQNTLKSLIDQTYQVEEQYKALNHSYESLREFTRDIIESMGAAIWVREGDKIKLANTMATKNYEILSLIDPAKNAQEIQFGDKFYAVKITKKDKNEIILATDISDEKRSARLVSMGAVAAHLSHEIRNPIGSISLLTSTLLKRADDKSRPIVEEIRKAIFRVERIIKATLLFTKGVRINRAIFSLGALKSACEAAVSQYAYSKEIKFKFENFEGEMNADLDLLELVFSNFLFNAIDAIEESEDESGEVALRYAFEDGRHNFYISDTGVKIDPSVVFEPFKTTKLKGNGLGLALSVEIINAHKGSISLQNEPKVFTVSLPA